MLITMNVIELILYLATLISQLQLCSYSLAGDILKSHLKTKQMLINFIAKYIANYYIYT